MCEACAYVETAAVILLQPAWAPSSRAGVVRSQDLLNQRRTQLYLSLYTHTLLQQSCMLQSNSTASTALSCAQKLVVTLTVDSGDSIPTQNIQLSLNCIGRCDLTRALAASS